MTKRQPTRPPKARAIARIEPARNPKRRLTAEKLQAAGLPSPKCIPKVRADKTANVATLPLDPRAAFLLTQLDGGLTLQQLVDLGILERDETIRILRELADLGIVYFA